VAPSIDQNTYFKTSTTRKDKVSKQSDEDPQDKGAGKKNGRWNQQEKDKFVEGR